MDLKTEFEGQFEGILKSLLQPPWQEGENQPGQGLEWKWKSKAETNAACLLLGVFIFNKAAS